MSTLVPYISFGYFSVVITFTMVLFHPYFVVLSLITSFISTFTLLGSKQLKRIPYYLILIIIVSLINPIFNTNGQRVLFSYFNRPYQLEPLVYGFILSLVFISVLNWFSCYSAIITKDKFFFIFGKKLPSFSMVMSLTMSLIPSYIKQGKEIYQNNKSLGEHSSKTKLSAATFAALFSISLEESLITTASMKARGYELNNKTHYKHYDFKGSDIVITIVLSALILALCALLLLDKSKAMYFPYMEIHLDNLFPITIALYALLLLFPLIITIIKGKKRFNK